MEPVIRDTEVVPFSWLALAAMLAIGIACVCGCATQTRSEALTDLSDDITIAGTIQVPKAEGGVQPVPMQFTIARRGTERTLTESEAKTKPDYQEMGRAVAVALGPVLAAMAPAGGPSILSILGTVGAAATAATTGYLALKKREQLRPERTPPKEKS
jgi:hypothetical protein